MRRRLLALLAVASLLPACGGGGSSGPNEPPPLAPTGLAALTNSTRSVLLSWTDPTPDEYGFHIQYRPAGAGSFVPLLTAPVNTTSFVAYGLEPNTAYDFQVTAFNARGDSPPSNMATASTTGYSWTQLTNAAVPLHSAQAVYVPTLDRMVVFGGIDGQPLLTDDLYTIHPATGSMAVFTPASGTRPGPRFLPSVVYCSLRNSLLLFGGNIFPADVPVNDVWEFDFDTNLWAPLAPAGTPPSARNGHSAVYDPLRHTMIVFGGVDDVTFDLLNDVYRLSVPALGNPTWQTLSVSGTLPVARDRHTAIFDTLNSRMIVFGGTDNGAAGNPFTNELSALTVDGTSSVVWSRLSSQLDVPAPRCMQIAVYDSVNQQMVVFGGQLEGAGLGDYRVWTLSLDGSNVWHEITLPSGSGARMHGAGIFDPLRIRLVVFGGHDGINPIDPEIWALEL